MQLRPTRKVTAGGLGGSIGVLIVFGLRTAGLEVSPEVAAAISTVAGFIAGWIRTERVG